MVLVAVHQPQDTRTSPVPGRSRTRSRRAPRGARPAFGIVGAERDQVRVARLGDHHALGEQVAAARD